MKFLLFEIRKLFLLVKSNTGVLSWEFPLTLETPTTLSPSSLSSFPWWLIVLLSSILVRWCSMKVWTRTYIIKVETNAEPLTDHLEGIKQVEDQPNVHHFHIRSLGKWIGYTDKPNENQIKLFTYKLHRSQNHDDSFKEKSLQSVPSNYDKFAFKQVKYMVSLSLSLIRYSQWRF